MARKTIDEIDVARTAVAASLTKPGLSDQQKLILSGMSVALCWVAGVGGESLQRLIDGEEIEAGRKVRVPTFNPQMRGNSEGI